MNTQQSQSFDIIVAGGGASGMAFALALAQRSKLRIAIVEANPANRSQTEPSSSALEVRSVAMSAFSCEFLQRLGLAPLSELAQPIEHIYVSDSGHIGHASIHSHELGREYLGQVIELDVLNNALSKQIDGLDHEHIHWYCPDSITAVQQHQEHTCVELKSGLTLSAQLLVIADGGGSSTRELGGFEVQRKEYGQSAIVANIQFDSDHNNKAYERFTPDGPLALLPMRGAKEATMRQCSLVWTIDSNATDHYFNMSDNEFIHALQAAFGYKLGRIIATGTRQVFPLSLTVTPQHTRHRIAVIGNAAQTLHPIAGQGLNLGIRDIAGLVNSILGQSDPGSFAVLNAYQAQRRADQQQTVNATDTLVRLFSNSNFPLTVGRNLGLLGLQSCATLKQRFAMHAMGFKQTRQIDAKL